MVAFYEKKALNIDSMELSSLHFDLKVKGFLGFVLISQTGIASPPLEAAPRIGAAIRAVGFVLDGASLISLDVWYGGMNEQLLDVNRPAWHCFEWYGFLHAAL
jgi:hypothetical protein